MRARWNIAASVLACMLVFARGAPSAPAGNAPVRIEQAWIRALPAGVPSGGYLTLTNTTDRPVALVGVSSPAFGEIELHRTVNRAGTMGMEPVRRIVLLPHATLDFTQEGYHLMLMKPVHALEAGEHIRLTLTFDPPGSQSIEADVCK
jgi:copper(I)-binding protein